MILHFVDDGTALISSFALESLSPALDSSSTQMADVFGG